MSEVLVEFQAPVSSADGREYRARACGCEAADGLWNGWIEFVQNGGNGVLRSPRETTQPNRTDTVYWARGLTPVYLQGALSRALSPTVVKVPLPPGPPAFDGPAPTSAGDIDPSAVPTVLDPFAVSERGEAHLRRQLGALSAWHLVNIVKAYELSEESAATLNRVPAAVLVDLIVSEVSRTRQTSVTSPGRV